MLEISPEKIAHVIVKAREFDAKVAVWDEPASAINLDDDADAILEDRTFSAEEFDDAIDTARAERTNPTEVYLLGIPLLADYLEEGLEKLGYSIEAVEQDVL